MLNADRPATIMITITTMATRPITITTMDMIMHNQAVR